MENDSLNDGPYELGIDISHHQNDKGALDWQQIAQYGIKHVMIKMTEGATYQDPYFVRNWQAANEHGLRTGVYHFFHPQSSAIDAQITNIKKALAQLQPAFDPETHYFAIDVETTDLKKTDPPPAIDIVSKLKELIDKLTDKQQGILSDKNKPMIYVGPNFWKKNFDPSSTPHDFSDYKLWIAHYNVAEPSIPSDWRKKQKSWTWWQYSDHGKVSEITGDVDMNHVKVTMP